MSVDPFCNTDEISGTIFHKTEHFMILYDIRPVVRGHVLFIPKRHVTDLLELTGEEVGDMHRTFAHAIPKILGIYCPKEQSYDITSQIGAYSGRTVPHLHFHLLPRSKDDGYQGESSSSIYEDLKLEKTHFSRKDVDAEVYLLRKEFGYKPAPRPV
jgi:diadenosine tetraphosphate (Ap4A) HIT family hydrolase